MGLVRPLLEYACSSWDPYMEQLITEIETIEHRAARFVLSDYKSYEPGSISRMLEYLGWTPSKLCRQMDTVTLLNKSKGG